MHRPHRAGPARSLGIAILTVSDTRTPSTDASGALARQLVLAAGHRVVDQRIVVDEAESIAGCLREWLGRADCAAIVATGGTGVAPRDRTCAVLAGLIERELPGFGELFRLLSFEQVGSAAMLSGALGGIASGKPLFALPGSPPAVELGLERLILPELGHLLDLLES
jgi:molybdopterin adenylyltransferase